MLMAGVGRTIAVPTALPHLCDAIGRAPADLFEDGNSVWEAETVLPPSAIPIKLRKPGVARLIDLRGG